MPSRIPSFCSDSYRTSLCGRSQKKNSWIKEQTSQSVPLSSSSFPPNDLPSGQVVLSYHTVSAYVKMEVFQVYWHSAILPRVGPCPKRGKAALQQFTAV